MSEVRLQGTERRIFEVKAGRLDHAALLAFTGSQCHGLALAIHSRTGWQLVAVDDHAGKCVHICVRNPADELIDVTGTHTAEEMTAASGGGLRDVDGAYVTDLQSAYGWVAPDPDGADSFVTPVLERAKSGVTLAPLKSSTLRREQKCEDGVLVRIDWEGMPYFDVYVGREPVPENGWTLYAHIGFPAELKSGDHLITFTPERLEGLAEAWLRYEYDPRRAAQKLA